MFSSRLSDTKGLLDSDDFQKENTAIQVWDVYSNSGSSDVMAWINGAYAVCQPSVSTLYWPFYSDGNASGTEEHYYWTLTGAHKFYGLLAYDAESGLKASGSGISPGSAAEYPTYVSSEETADWGWGYADGSGDSHIFHVPQPASSSDAPALTLLPSSGQFDFLYSNIVTRDLDSGDGTAVVPLRFSHLFSAFAFTLLNDSPETLTLTDVDLKVWGTASADLDYSSAWGAGTSDAPAVTYRYGSAGTSESSEEPDGSIAGIASYSGSSAELGSGTTSDLFVRDAEGNVQNAACTSLIWPQDLTGKSIGISFSASRVEDVYSCPGFGSAVSYVSSAEYTPGAGNYVRGTCSTDSSSGTVTFTADEDQENGNGIYFCIATKSNGFGNDAGFGDWTLTFTDDADNANSTYKTDASGNVISYSRSSVTVTRDKSVTIALYGVSDSDGNSITEWDPGKKYIYSLTYKEYYVDLTVSVLDWAVSAENTVEL